MPVEEGQLVKLARQGDTAAFETLVTMHATFVFNLALRTLNDPQEAEDIAQEAFVRAWQALPNFRAESRFRTWLYRIVTNLCYNRLPRLKSDLAALSHADTFEPLSERRPVENSVVTGELGATIYAAIDTLPEHYQLLTTLRHLQNMSYAEIAEVTGLPLGTVKTGLYRARRLLRDALEDHQE